MFHVEFVPEHSKDYFLRKTGFLRLLASVWLLSPAELKQDCRCPQWLATAVKREGSGFQFLNI